MQNKENYIFYIKKLIRKYWLKKTRDIINWNKYNIII